MIITCASVLLAKDVHSSMLTQLDGFVFCAVTIEAAFTKIGRDLEPQYWSSMATVLSSLDLAIQEKVTEERSAALCQLTRLKRLALRSVARASNTAEETVASIFLDLPALELLEVYRFGASQVRLNCPKLRGLHLLGLVLTSFSGMPSRIGNVRVSLLQGSVSLEAMFSAHSAQLLESLTIQEDPEKGTDPETVRRLCLNGKLKSLKIESPEAMNDHASPAAGAFSLQAPWQAVPHTLQEVYLDLPLDKGIPRILEQILSLEILSLRHSKGCCMHLDRPLDPFLAMPRLRQLRLESRMQAGDANGAGALTSWSPAALRLLGLAEKRLRDMLIASPARRSFTLIY